MSDRRTVWLTLLVSITLAGCEGTAGQSGAAGPKGEPGSDADPAQVAAALIENAEFRASVARLLATDHAATLRGDKGDAAQRTVYRMSPGAFDSAVDGVSLQVTKKHLESDLRVVFSAHVVLRSYLAWTVLFNGERCSDPGAISVYGQIAGADLDGPNEDGLNVPVTMHGYCRATESGPLHGDVVVAIDAFSGDATYIASFGGVPWLEVEEILPSE